MGLIAALLILLVVFGAICYESLTWGLVFFKFWAWFVLPVFTGLPELSFWAAVGLSLFVSLFKNHVETQIDDKYQNKPATVTVALLAPWITLFAGWLIGNMFIF